MCYNIHMKRNGKENKSEFIIVRVTPTEKQAIRDKGKNQSKTVRKLLGWDE